LLFTINKPNALLADLTTALAINCERHTFSLIDDINALNIGIDIDNGQLAILLYADDVVLLTENEKDLQKMLDVLNFWCINNALYVNVNKFKIMHFRNPSVPRTYFNFTVNGNSVFFL
jgi:hypothetical protein